MSKLQLDGAEGCLFFAVLIIGGIIYLINWVSDNWEPFAAIVTCLVFAGCICYASSAWCERRDRKKAENEQGKMEEDEREHKKQLVRQFISLIGHHFGTLYDKYRQTRYKDDYGYHVEEDWYRERERFIKCMVEREMEGDSDIPAVRIIFPEEGTLDIGNVGVRVISEEGDLITVFDEVWNWLLTHKKLPEQLSSKSCATKTYGDFLTPIEYEHKIAQLLQGLGFQTRVTKASGDQGCDVIAEKNGVSFAIQCKLYSTPVGNKAVQEVNAARDFYNKDFGVVVTNSSYTKSARQLAQTSSVILLSDTQLEELLAYTKD